MGSPCVFLDRDGVLNKRHFPVVRKPSQLVLLPGIAESVARFSRAGFKVVIATNQEFVGDGYIRRADHEAVMRLVIAECQSKGGVVTDAFACTHSHWRQLVRPCHDRKPRAGMLLDAARQHDLDLGRSFMVGDQAKDMLAGRAAGCRTVLVDPRPRTRRQGAEQWADHVCADLPAAADWILAS